MAVADRVGQRRARRRQETIDEIKSVAIAVMGEDGVAGLTLAEIARRMGMRPPSLYKYFPSRVGLYDELFRDGHTAYRQAFLSGATGRAPGWPSLTGALEAGSRWVLANPALAQLLFFRPVPGFEPSARAFAPSLAMVGDVRAMLAQAVAAGQLAPDAEGEDGEAMLSSLVAGVMAQQIANQPGVAFETGRYSRLLPRLLEVFARIHAPRSEQC